MYTLHVRVVEAEDIPKMDVISATDAYCILKTSSETRKTFVCKDSMHPRWNQEFHFNVTALNAGSLNITMRDKDVLFDDNISHLDIQFCSLQFGQVIDQWYNMIPFPKVRKGGRLHLVLHMTQTGLPPFVPSMNPQGSVIMQTPIYPQQGYMTPAYPSQAFIPQQSGFIPQQQMYPQHQQMYPQQQQMYPQQPQVYPQQQFYPNQQPMYPTQQFNTNHPTYNPQPGYPGYPPRY